MCAVPTYLFIFHSPLLVISCSHPTLSYRSLYFFPYIPCSFRHKCVLSSYMSIPTQTNNKRSKNTNCFLSSAIRLLKLMDSFFVLFLWITHAKVCMLVCVLTSLSKNYWNCNYVERDLKRWDITRAIFNPDIVRILGLKVTIVMSQRFSRYL